MALPLPPDLWLPLLSPLAAAGAWLGLQVAARRLPAGSLGRELLQRCRLSVGVTLLLTGLAAWMLTLAGRSGRPLPLEPRELRDALLTLGVLWTVLRCRRPLLRHLEADSRWLSGRATSDRAFLLDLLGKLIAGLVVTVAVLQVLRLLGVSAAVLLTASGLGAAALGFGARTLVENLLSGAMLYANRPFGPGDRIELPDRRLAGGVRAIGALATELLNDDGLPVYLPNSLFATHAIANASRRVHRRLLLEVALRPGDHPLAEGITADLRRDLETWPGVEASQPRRVHVVALDDAGLRLRIECSAGADPEVFHRLRQELLLRAVAVAEGHGAALAADPGKGAGSSGLRPAPDGPDRP